MDTLVDEEMFSDLYDGYWERVFQYVIRILPDEDDAADVLQEPFVTVWEVRNQLAHVKSTKSYLFAMARNFAFKRFRERAKEADFSGQLVRYYSDTDESATASVYGKELSEWFDREVNRLPARMREVFVLSRKEHLSYKEIGERLNISDQTVKKQVSKSLKLLRLKLD